MKQVFLIVVLLLCIGIIHGQKEDNCEKQRKYNAEFWEKKYNFTSTPSGGQIAGFYNSSDMTSQLPDRYPDGAMRPIASYAFILIKWNDEVTFRREINDLSLSWLSGNTARLYVIKAQSGDLETVDIGIGRQLFSYVINAGDFYAMRIRNNREDRFSLIGSTDTPGYFSEDGAKVEIDEMLAKFPQHSRIIRSFSG